MTAPAEELAELRALAKRMLERLDRMEQAASEGREVDEPFTAQEVADFRARRRKRGRR